MDLHTSRSPDLDIQELVEKEVLRVDSLDSSKKTEDFSNDIPSLSFSSDVKLELSRKSTPFFDALGKKTFFQKLKDPLFISSKKNIDRKTPVRVPEIETLASKKSVF